MSAVASVISGVLGSSGSGGEGDNKSGLDTILQGGQGSASVSSIVDMIAGKVSADELFKALDRATNQWNAGYQQVQGYYAPYLKGGQQDYTTLRNLVNSGAYDVNMQPFSYTEAAPTYQGQGFNFQEEPGYQFRLNQGLGAINAAGAAQGSLLSGATQQALTKYASDLASQEYSNAYGRYQQDRSFDYNRYINDLGQWNANRRFNYGVYSDDYNRQRANALDKYGRLNSLVGMGYDATGTMADYANNYYGGLANLEMQRGNVGASKYQMYGNAIGNMFTGAGGIGNVNTGNSQSQQQAEQPYTYDYQPATAYPNGVPNSNLDYFTGVDYDPEKDYYKDIG